MEIKSDEFSNNIVVIKDELITSKFNSFEQTQTWRERFSEYLAELLATFMFVSIRTGSVAQSVINSGSGLIGSVGYGLALIFAIFLAGSVSGGHVNPAITLPLVCFCSFPLRKVPGYFLCQFIGSFLGACVVMLMNYPKLNAMDPSITIDIFTSSPNRSITAVFFLQLLAAGFLLIGVQASANAKIIPNWLFPIACGIVSTGIGLAFPGITLNPAIDLSGRVFTSITGWGSMPFTSNPGYFVVPIVAPCLGAIMGVALYDFIFIHPRIQFMSKLR